METIVLWAGIGVDEQFQAVHARVAALEEELGIANANPQMPFHISLKMSFPIETDRMDEVVRCLEDYYRTLPSFPIPVKGVEYHETIAWIRMAENETLNRIHDELDKMLFERFGVELHEFDRDFIFHTTLFMDDDTEKVRKGYEAMLGEAIPAVLQPEFFMIGASEAGVLGTYRIIREVAPQGSVNQNLTQRQPKVDAASVRLTPMTSEMYHEYYKEYENDPDLYRDPSKFVPYEYSEEKVERYLQRLRDLKRISLAIMVVDEIAGEIVLKNIEPHQQATMGLTLKNAAYKDRGIGMQAERLAVQYVFEELDIPVLYADTIRTNTRSQHVLEKVGFRFLREDEDFKYYEIRRE